MADQHALEVPAEALRWSCPAEALPAEGTRGVEPAAETLIQPRALQALRTGVELNGPGYNLFVCGLAGDERAALVSGWIRQLNPPARSSLDRCYVNNFRHPDQPRLLTFPPGQAMRFKKDMASAIAFLRRRIPQLFESDTFERRRNRIVERYAQREKEIMEEFTQRIGREQFALVRVAMGTEVLPELAPVIEGQVVPVEELGRLVEAGKLSPERAEELARRYAQFREEFTSVYRKTLELSRELSQEIGLLEQEAASTLVDSALGELAEKYPAPAVVEYLEQVREHILNHLDDFKRRDGEEPRPSEPVRPAPPDPFRVYEVNVLLAHDEPTTCPVVFEAVPSYANLFGTVQHGLELFGARPADFLDLRAGALLRADGGFLILYALDVLLERGVWPTLKRALMHRRLDIQAGESLLPLFPPTLKPEPIEIDVKVVLIGDRWLYELLYALEEDFRKIFKVLVEFDQVLPWSPELVQQYTAQMRGLCEREGLPALDRSALAAVLEHGVRLAGRRGRVTARLPELADVVREASYIARGRGADAVTGEHVRAALQAREQRHNLLAEKIREWIEEQILLIDTTGARVGQVNGLSILEVGGFAFGKPVRITAAVAPGRSGLINIEREANLSGRLHDKGVQIIAGYLRRTFARDKPLSLAASICFEQSYSGVDGDSASSTEVYAILSALAELPLRQDLAVTGSVNQHGDIQPIGGVNEKIEGFFDVCRARGLTGTQGVIIPRGNLNDLMLREDVVEAVRAGQFHIYAVATVEQGIELLTGVAAGQRDSSGAFPPESVFGRVDRRLREMAETLRGFEGTAG